MEITREEAIKTIENAKHFAYEAVYDEAFDMAIETMRKYQRIEEIMHKVYTSDNADVCLVQRLAEIREVLEGDKE